MGPDIDLTSADGSVSEARAWEFFVKTYEHFQDALVHSEDLGERRVSLLMSVTSAGGVALGLAANASIGSVNLLWTASATALFLVAFGSMTVLRLAQRDVASSQLKLDLQVMRRRVAQDAPWLANVVPHATNDGVQYRVRPYLPCRGGLAEMAALITALLGGAATASAVLAGAHPPTNGGVLLAVVASVLAVTAVWLLMMLIVRRVYGAAGILRAAFPDKG